MQTALPYQEGNIVPIDIYDEMKQSFVDYAMSVIVSRALPDVRDGLKPVHRRILFSMYENNLTPERKHRKSATVVGDVLGKYHPHGDSSVYDAMVRLAQDFSIRYPLVDGHGNFGSVDGDPAAAYRYTEARMSKVAVELLNDIDFQTVDFTPNFDGTIQEPTVLPALLPNLLLNGVTGIAVGMATNIPPHNLQEIVDALTQLIDNPEMTVDDLAKYVQGPDFPTGGAILGDRGILEAYRTGRGSVTTRAIAEVETNERTGRNALIVTELPYQVNKARLIEHIADLVRDKKLDGISDLRDESDRDGMRMVIELKRDAIPQVVLNNLYKQTDLQNNFGIILLALVNGHPEVLNLKAILSYYLEHRVEVVTRRTRFFLVKAQAREHLVEGFLTILNNLDRAVETIRKAENLDMARANLIERFTLSLEQANAVLDMQLRRLTGLEKQKLDDELAELKVKITDLQSILATPERINMIIKEELNRLATKFGDGRRSQLLPDPGDFRHEDLIPDEPMAVFITNEKYAKRLHLDTFEQQGRGGMGRRGMATRENDFLRHFFIASSHSPVLFFTNKGLAYSLKVYELPEAGRQAKGSNLANLLPLAPGEFITAVIPVSEFSDGAYLMMLTKGGLIKKTPLSAFSAIRRNGLIAISLREGDELGWVSCTDGNQYVVIGTQNGMVMRFHEEDCRPMGRTAQGVKAITLRKTDAIIGYTTTGSEEQDLLIVSDVGIGKRTPISEFRDQNRGGIGLIGIKLRKEAKVASLLTVDETDQVVIVTQGAIVIRQKIAEISRLGRNTVGVRLQRVDEDDRIVAVAPVAIADDDEGEGEPDVQMDKLPLDPVE